MGRLWRNCSSAVPFERGVMRASVLRIKNKDESLFYFANSDNDRTILFVRSDTDWRNFCISDSHFTTGSLDVIRSKSPELLDKLAAFAGFEPPLLLSCPVDTSPFVVSFTLDCSCSSAVANIRFTSSCNIRFRRSLIVSMRFSTFSEVFAIIHRARALIGSISSCAI